MSQDLKDFRGKITPRTHAVLAAMSETSGDEIGEIARRVLDKWAGEQIHAANLIVRRTQGEGAAGDS
jgi:hypothetical protein